MESWNGMGDMVVVERYLADCGDGWMGVTVAIMFIQNSGSGSGAMLCFLVSVLDGCLDGVTAFVLGFKD